MGKAMSTAFLHSKRVFYRYNAENRALKYIEKEKLPLAPRHEKTEKILKEVRQENAAENAAAFDNIKKKDQNLDQYLKEVYLTSSGENPEIKVMRPLPENRISRSEYVFIEPEEVPKGFCVLSKIVKFLDDHRRDPKLWTAEKIAEEYQLEKDKVDILLKYFGSFVLYGRDYEASEDEPYYLDMNPVDNFKDAFSGLRLESEKSSNEIDQKTDESKSDVPLKSLTEEPSELKVEKSKEEKPMKVSSISK